MRSADLKELHDATLTSLEVDWGKGEFRCNFKVSMGKRTTLLLSGHGLTSLMCPRRFPWGRSVSVNDARVEKHEKDILLIIEMQSGDVIEANLKDMTLE